MSEKQKNKARSIEHIMETLTDKQKKAIHKKFPTLDTVDKRLKYVNAFNKKTQEDDKLPSMRLTIQGMVSVCAAVEAE